MSGATVSESAESLKPARNLAFPRLAECATLKRVENDPERVDEWLSRLVESASDLTKQGYAQDFDWLAAAVTMVLVGRSIRFVATDILCSLKIDPASLCARRLAELAEEAGVPYTPTIGSTPHQAGPLTWRGLQLAEAEHRRECGPLVACLSLVERLRYYSMRLAVSAAKIGLSFGIAQSEWEDTLETALADLLLLGVTLASDVDEDLCEETIPTTPEEIEAALDDDELG